jgi:hypothetical protein
MFHIFFLESMTFINGPAVAFFKNAGEALKFSNSWSFCSSEDYYRRYPRGLV